jgi:hypothetical protein
MPVIVPLLHPSAIVKGRWNEDPAQVVYLKRAVRFVRGDVDPDLFLDTSVPPPRTQLCPTLRHLADFNLETPNWPALSIDIENAGKFITLIGITLYSDTEVGPTLSLPFRTQHGINYWSSWSEHLTACEHLYSWLSDPRTIKCFHNGVSHDVPLLTETGFEVNGPLEDTMVAAHWCYPEQRKGLQYQATLMLGFPVWKDLVNEEEDADGKS